MATTRATGRESNPVDDEFLHHLYRGGELLAAGKVIEAKDFLERAHKLQPKNEKGQNLLGLTYFKLGLFDRAAELYEMLVRDNPVDPTLRVNLGLVYLKTNALQRAVREFEVAVDLAPDHKKAHNYLGLALAQQGEYGRAREHFLLAGSDVMAEKMARAISGEGFSRPPPVQPAKTGSFAELEGTEVVREHGGVPVPETPAPVTSSPSPGSDLAFDVVEEAPAEQSASEQQPPPLPPPGPEPSQPLAAAEDDWGAQFGLDESGHQSEAPAPEEASEAEAPVAAHEAPIPESEVSEYAAEESFFGAEGPVVAASNASGQEAQPSSFEEQAPDVPAQEAAAVAPVPEDSLPAVEAPASGDNLPSGATESEDNLPVFAVEEISEDGLPLLTAEPENAEDLAAIAQHEQVPAEGAQEALPPPAPPEAPPEAAFEEISAALAASEPEAPLPAEEAASAAPGVQQAEPAEASPTTVSTSLVPQSAEPAPTGRRFWQEGRVPVLGELVPALTLVGAGTASRFTVGEGGFSALVDGELLTRLDGLVAFTGQVTFQPEMKRFRGRTTDKPFGEGPARMVRASGRGVLFIEPAGKRTFQAVDLGDESAYFRDECVFAFEEPVMFENGRVPSDMAPDLDLVHLRGDGKVLLSLEGPLRSVPVGMEAAVTVPLTHLVGWQGNLTPRVVPLLQGAEGEILKTAVELSGEGFALICLPVR